MDVAIIGLPQSGKTTVFNALTGGVADLPGAGGRPGETRVGVAKVPDPRLDTLAQIYQPKKVIHAEVKYWDLPSADPGARPQEVRGKYRNTLQGVDAFLLVVRAFSDPAVHHSSGDVDANRDLNTMLEEIVFTDLESLDRAGLGLAQGST